MNFAVIFYVLGFVLRIEGLLMFIPALVGAGYRERECIAFFAVGALAFLLGLAISFRRPKNQVFYAKEGFVCVALSWIMISVVGCLPFIWNGDIPNFTDAFFEMVSGFTTTGSSILTDVGALSHASLFWRSFSHWIGGMGVLVFLLSVLPMSGGAAMNIMKAESPGPQVGKMVPKLRESSMILYIIYTAMTIAEIIVYIIGGMPVFDAVTVGFGVAGTGGFSVRNSGLAEYSTFCQYAIGVFMILFGVNFNVYYLLLAKKIKQAFSSEEVWSYLGIIAAATLAIALNTLHLFGTVEETFRYAFVHVSSIITTTGFTAMDYNLYPEISKQILIFLMFIGACAGSTGGGMKVSRLIVLLKSVRNELSRIIHPRTVKRIRLEGKVVEHETLRSINTYFVALLALYCVSLLIVSMDDFDAATNLAAVATTINNVGPGISLVGPTGNFSGFSDLSKYVFCFDMLAGRLEMFPMLVLFSPYTWHQAFKRKKKKLDEA